MIVCAWATNGATETTTTAIATPSKTFLILFTSLTFGASLTHLWNPVLPPDIPPPKDARETKQRPALVILVKTAIARYPADLRATLELDIDEAQRLLTEDSGGSFYGRTRTDA